MATRKYEVDHKGEFEDFFKQKVVEGEYVVCIGRDLSNSTLLKVAKVIDVELVANRWKIWCHVAKWDNSTMSFVREGPGAFRKPDSLLRITLEDMNEDMYYSMLEAFND